MPRSPSPANRLRTCGTIGVGTADGRRLRRQAVPGFSRLERAGRGIADPISQSRPNPRNDIATPDVTPIVTWHPPGGRRPAQFLLFNPPIVSPQSSCFYLATLAASKARLTEGVISRSSSITGGSTPLSSFHFAVSRRPEESALTRILKRQFFANIFSQPRHRVRLLADKEWKRMCEDERNKYEISSSSSAA